MKTRMTRRRAFRCPQAYDVQDWTSDRALATGGLCLTPAGHGHDYAVELTLEGPIEPESGMILNLIDVDQSLARAIGPLEQRTPDRAPTAEAIAAYLLETLSSEFDQHSARVVKLRVFESDDLWVDAWP